MSDNPIRDGWLRRIQALLAKAASTEHPAEAEAFIAKAHELMERHAIDEAAVASAGDPHLDRTVRLHHLHLPNPYARARTCLLSAVAASSYCRLVIDRRGGPGLHCTLVGRSLDIDHALATYGVLELQALRAMAEVAVGATRPRAFRHAFLLAYARRIGERLREARWAERSRAPGGGTSTELVSVDRWSEVDRAVRDHFGDLRRSTASASSASGVAFGRDAADRSDLGRAHVGAPPALPRSNR